MTKNSPPPEQHAIAIMAYRRWTQLQKLIDTMDDGRVDFYLHIDAKSMKNYEASGGVKARNSKVVVVKNPVDVRWSDVSLADAEVKLFEAVAASGKAYRYVHLISGEDMPIVEREAFFGFFAGRTEEFMSLDRNAAFEKNLRYHHFFTRNRRNNKVLDYMRKGLLALQWGWVNRLKRNPLAYVHGGEWASLTLGAVREIVAEWPRVRKHFVRTSCPDAFYKQMIVNAKGDFVFAPEGNLRYIIFDKGQASPRVLSTAEWEDMKASGCVFGRKFEEGTAIFEQLWEMNKA